MLVSSGLIEHVTMVSRKGRMIFDAQIHESLYVVHVQNLKCIVEQFAASGTIGKMF